ncbi:hypothetical protein PAXRUDRAFT_828518 [Paxillus rubicundulus Ve08.2h10]|uniref:Uncharacterized protein n=1 Tax=Paxillus rubicundulus Ve08.2h10 TaxID=930991 RepID=A0A0D0DPK2_9AGAM|nr:hypothetical protein PAXRUDRAFT_828518 [Paxillus rubicundulus Ve08.2h10]
MASQVNGKKGLILSFGDLFSPSITRGRHMQRVVNQSFSTVQITNSVSCSISNDIALARAPFSLFPLAWDATDIASQDGVDLLLGGHNHYCWVLKGVTSWDGYDVR